MSIFNKSKKDAVDKAKSTDQPKMQIEQKLKTIKIKHKVWEEVKKLDQDNQKLKNGLMTDFLQREKLTNKIRTQHRDVSIVEDRLKVIVDEAGVKKGEQFRLTPNEDELEVIYFAVKKEEPKVEGEKEQK